MALPGRGKRGGARTLIATNKSSRWFFVFGFEKSERENISGEELQALKDYADDWLERTSAQLDEAVAALSLLADFRWGRLRSGRFRVGFEQRRDFAPGFDVGR